MSESLRTLAEEADARHTTPLRLLRFCHRHGVPVWRANTQSRWVFPVGASLKLDQAFEALASKDSDAAFQRNEAAIMRREMKATKTARDQALSERQIVETSIRWKPYRSGVYFLIKSRRVIYVGQAANVIIRVSTHAFTKKFDAWHWIPCRREKLNELERIYINAFLPPLNRDSATRRMRSSRELEGAVRKIGDQI